MNQSDAQGQKTPKSMKTREEEGKKPCMQYNWEGGVGSREWKGPIRGMIPWI